MKYHLPLFFVLALCFGCEEQNDLIDFSPPADVKDTTYVDAAQASVVDPKTVLITDFTGVQCVNCPEAASIIKDIKEEHGSQVVSVAIHAGSQLFIAPIDEKGYKSIYDFRTEAGSLLADFTKANSLPRGDIDRVEFDGESAISVSRERWAGYTKNRLEEATNSVNVSAEELEWNEETRQLKVRVKIVYTQSVQENHFLSIYLLENDLIDVQEDLSGFLPEYKHEHVFRSAVTAWNGDPLSEGAEVGRVYEKVYTVSLKNPQIELGREEPEWVKENMSVLSFVHFWEEGNRTIIQANELDL